MKYSPLYHFSTGYISCYIAENRFRSGQCTTLTQYKFIIYLTVHTYDRKMHKVSEGGSGGHLTLIPTLVTETGVNTEGLNNRKKQHSLHSYRHSSLKQEQIGLNNRNNSKWLYLQYFKLVSLIQLYSVQYNKLGRR